MAELAYLIGRCGGYVLAGQAEKPTVLICTDTANFWTDAAGCADSRTVVDRANVIRLGIVTTPCVAYLTRVMSG